MAYDFEKSLGNGNMAQMIRSRSRIDTFFGQVEGEYSVGDKWLFTADLSVHQHLVESVDKNVLPMKDPQQLGGNRKNVQVGYDQGRVELSGYVSAKYQPTDPAGAVAGAARGDVRRRLDAGHPRLLRRLRAFAPRQGGGQSLRVA